jgi:Transglutaminase-like superfamily
VSPRTVLNRLVRDNHHKLSLLLVLLLGLGGAMPYHGLFVQWMYILPVAGFCLLSLVVSSLGRALRWAWWLTVTVFLIAGTLYIGEAVYPGKAMSGLPTPGMLGAVWRGVTSSWVALVGGPVPADAIGDATVLPMLLAALAVLIGAELVQRTTWRVPPIIPGLLTYGIGLAFAGAERQPSLAEAAATAGLTLTLLYRRCNPTKTAVIDRPERARPAAFRRAIASVRTLGFLAAFLLIGTALGWTIPVLVRTRPFGLRDHYIKPIEIRDSVTPLASLGSRSETPTKTTVLFTVKFSDIPHDTTIDRVPFALLEDYNGAAWGTRATFDNAARRLPTALTIEATSNAPRVRQEYVLKSWWSSFLPALEHPTALPIGNRSLAVDGPSGMLTTRSTLKGELSYTVDSAVRPGGRPNLTGREVSKADGTLASWGDFPKDDVLPELARFLSEGVASKPTPIEQLQALETKLKAESFNISSKATPGHSIGRLQQLVYDDPEAHAPAAFHFGTSEQYAAAFALGARLLTLPSRVVVGYAINPTAAASGDAVEVTADKVMAWPEVLVNGLGWVSFDPTPTTEKQPGDPVIQPTPTIVPGVDGPPGQIPCPPLCSPEPPKTRSAGSTFSWWWLLALPGIAVVALFTSIGARTFLRRKRKSIGDPAQRIIGAWRESADLITGCGLAPRVHSLTPGDVATAIANRSPQVAEHLEQLAPLIDVALYSPTRPSPEDAAASWAIEKQVRKNIRQIAPAAVRLRSAIDPRPAFQKRPSVRPSPPTREPELV